MFMKHWIIAPCVFQPVSSEYIISTTGNADQRRQTSADKDTRHDRIY
jgi:hypothetical protein